jgi:carboxyl-terminal processing protease
MASDSGTSGPPGGHQSTHLPILTWSLLALLLIWFIAWFFVYRPPAAERLRLRGFARALDAIPELYVEEVDQELLYRGALRGMVAALNDKYSVYLTRDQMQRVGEETKGEFAGIGVKLAYPDARIVHEVLPDGPAAQVGIEAGDVITHVDGTALEGLPPGAIVDMVRGEAGSEVVLTVLRPPTEETFTRSITRAKIRLPNVESRMLEEGIGLLRVAGFDSDSAEEVGNALKQLKADGMNGLVMDLRGNSGGLIKQATLMCDMFLSEGLIVGLKSRNGPPEKPTNATPGAIVSPTVPVVVLADRWTASAAEILAGCLQAHGRAEVVGTKTVGKGAVTTVLPLPDQSGIMLTVSHYELEGGGIIEGRGIEPDEVVGELAPPPEDLERAKLRDWFLAQRDKADEEQLERAVKMLKEELARR